MNAEKMINKIKRIDIDPETQDVTFYFEDSSEPFSIHEFVPDSFTWKALDRIEYEIADYNSEIELMNNDTISSRDY